MQLSAPVICFTDPALIPVFQTLRSSPHHTTPSPPTLFVPRPFAELDVWKCYKPQWQGTHTLDPEPHHTPELYAVWAAKAFCLEEAARLNPFGSDYFYWCDIGAFREPPPPAVLATWPDAGLMRQHLGTNKILLTTVEPLRPTEDVTACFKHVNRIVGGLWGGHREAIGVWRSAYEQTLLRYFNEGRFAGKDQSIMLSAALEYPELVSIVEPPPHNRDRWFFAKQLLCTPPLSPWRNDTTYTRPPRPFVAIQLTGGLGNQLFQVAVALITVRRTGRRLWLLPHTQAPTDTQRPTYWDTILARFRHCLTPPANPNSHPLLRISEPRGPTVWHPITVPDNHSVLLSGYFQSGRYFSDPADRELIRSVFRPPVGAFKPPMGPKDRTVVVHARRGDYCAAAEHHGPQPVTYYTAAMARMRELMAPVKPLFLLTADDPAFWWEEVIPCLSAEDEFEILMEPNDVAAFTALQQFHHFIIANSTFSWWCAVMAQEAKHVIAPRQWFGPAGPREWDDIYEPSWEQV